MKFDINPLVGAGPLNFGMKREVVRNVLNSPCEEFFKTPESNLPTDDFADLNIHVFYNPALELNGMEFWPDSNLELQGRRIVRQSVKSVSEWLNSIDPALTFKGSLIISHKMGLSLYAPHIADNPDAPIESAYVFRKWE